MLAGLLFVFWAVVVLVMGEWLSVRAWGGFVGGVYVLNWQFYPGADAEAEGQTSDEADEREG